MRGLNAICLVFVVFVASAFAEDNVAVSGDRALMSAYQEQHSRLLDALLTCDQEDARIYKDRVGALQQGRTAQAMASFSRLTGTAYRNPFAEYRADQAVGKNQSAQESLEQQKRDNERKRQELEIEKGKLKVQVLEKSGTAPSWWEANETLYFENRKAIAAQALAK
jgi:hypothetical protein